MDLENNNNDFLALPENLKLSGYNPDWAKYIKLKYQNSSDCSDEYSNVKIDLLNNQIIPIYPKIDDSTKKWFGTWEALLSNDNKQTYSSSMLMIFSNNIAEKNNNNYEIEEILYNNISKKSFGSVTDVTDQFVMINFNGTKIFELFSFGCPFDFNQFKEKKGFTTQTIINHIDVIIHHKDSNNVNLFIRRSFSEHLWSWINDAASRM